MYSVSVLLLLLHCFIFILVLLLCFVYRSSLYCNIHRLVYSVFVLLLLLHCFIFILVLLLCWVSRSSLYCNITSDLSTLCLSCMFNVCHSLEFLHELIPLSLIETNSHNLRNRHNISQCTTYYRYPTNQSFRQRSNFWIC